MSDRFRTRVVHIRSEEWRRTPPKRRVRIDRIGKWGNPWHIGKDGTREEVIAKYRSWIEGRDGGESLGSVIVRELRGKTLGCWCKPLACHGDVLVEIAEGRPE